MSRPTFAKAWAAAIRIYSPIDSGAKVAKIIGGKVDLNIAPKGKWTNTCAVRMSYILNQSGHLIPFSPSKTVSGSNGQWHYYYVQDLITYLQRVWGKPDKVINYPVTNTELKNKKGLILFSVTGWIGASGHATLWNGSECYDSCYFASPETNYRTDQALFWELK
ncbi:MAG: type VI secretion system amidase effector protein Tae4 [Pelistega sp.]|nr:type VI secretion system amidase effector protein Tae4 [Pelistega sp.]